MGRRCGACSLALTSMTESRKAQWQCASTTRLECHVRMRGCAELSYRDSRCLLIPVGKPLSCEIREKGRRERKREGGEKKRRVCRACMCANHKWLSRQVIPFIARKYRGHPMINLFSFGKRARPLEQCYWPICRATHGINCCFRYRMLVALTPTARYALFSNRGTLFHNVNVSFALSCTFIAYTQIFKHYNCTKTRLDTSAFPRSILL